MKNPTFLYNRKMLEISQNDLEQRKVTALRKPTQFLALDQTYIRFLYFEVVFIVTK